MSTMARRHPRRQWVVVVAVVVAVVAAALLVDVSSRSPATGSTRVATDLPSGSVAPAPAAFTTTASTTPPTPSTAPAQPDRRLWIQGDSVLRGSQAVLAAALPSWNVTLAAFGGLQLAPAIDVFRTHLGSLGPAVVIEL